MYSIYSYATKKLSLDLFDFEIDDIIDSDHNEIRLKVNTKIDNNQKVHKLNRINWSKYSELTNSIPDKCFISSDIDQSIENITNFMIDCSEKAKIIIKSRHQILILPKNIISLIKNKQKLRRIYMKSRNDLIKTQINKLKQIIEKEIANQKQQTWNRLCEKAKRNY